MKMPAADEEDETFGNISELLQFLPKKNLNAKDLTFISLTSLTLQFYVKSEQNF